MRNIYSYSFFAILGLVLLVMSVGASQVYAAGALVLSPSTGTGNQFDVQILLDTGSEETIETDVVLNYDPTVLQVGEVTFGQLYPENIHNIDAVAGSLSMFSYFSGTDSGNSFSGTGVLATVQFNGLSPGTSVVSIQCIPSATNESNIIRQSPSGDILDCQAIGNGTYTVSLGGVTPTPTIVFEVSPTPTTAVMPTPTKTVEIGTGALGSPTPTPVQELLESGFVTPTLTLSLVGAMFLMGSVVLFIL